MNTERWDVIRIIFRTEKKTTTKKKAASVCNTVPHAHGIVLQRSQKSPLGPFFGCFYEGMFICNTIHARRIK